MHMTKYPCVYMRGGTSKACIFHKKDLPEDYSKWPELFMKIMGTPDAKQIDGMGGTVSSTSKIAVVAPSEHPGADIDYTFFQVLIDRPIVVDTMNCGNISSAVGPFAIDEGLVEAKEPITIVRIFNTNTNKIIEEHIRVECGKAMVYGDTEIQGVPGTGSKIDMFFKDPTGAGTGKTFPSGNRRDTIDIPGYSPVEVTMFDCANPVVFIKAEAIGLDGGEHTELNNDPEILARLERIRAVAAQHMGIVDDYREATAKGIGPLIAFVSTPRTYTSLDGNTINESKMDICCRGLNLGKVHRAYPMSLGVATSAAAKLEDTIVYDVTRRSESTVVRLGHASGITTADVRLDKDCNVDMVGIVRTARRIMDGYVYVRKNET